MRPSAARVRRGSTGAQKLVEIDGNAGLICARLVAAFGEAPA